MTRKSRMEPLPEFINGFRVVEDLGMVSKGPERGRGAIFECHICSGQFENLVKLAKRYKSCGCAMHKPLLKPIPDEINGFKIIKDLGTVSSKSYRVRRCISECKVCEKHFEVNVPALSIQNSCGCSHDKKPLPESINGFRIISEVPYVDDNKRRVLSVCKVCGFEFTGRADCLKAMKSCGVCYKNYPDRLVWLSHNMLQRCRPKNKDRYKYHAGKGVSVCKEWKENKLLFCQWSLENGYDDTKTIDRIDSEKDYSPLNCRWVSMQEQAQNNSSTVLNIDLVASMRELSKSMSCADVARFYGIDKTTTWQAIRGITWSNV